MNPSIWPSLAAFAAVVAAIPVALLLLKRFQGGRVGQRGIVTLVGGLSLGPRERIAVVEAGGKWLVLGITPQSVNLLTAIDDPAQAPRAGRPGGTPEDTLGASFAQILSPLTDHAKPAN